MKPSFFIVIYDPVVIHRITVVTQVMFKKRRVKE